MKIYTRVVKKDKENFTILILGGSQGAEIFGTIVPPVIKIDLLFNI